jgi:hypothetical protein
MSKKKDDSPKKRNIDKENYYKLFDELATLGRLRRLRLQREAEEKKKKEEEAKAEE